MKGGIEEVLEAAKEMLLSERKKDFHLRIRIRILFVQRQPYCAPLAVFSYLKAYDRLLNN
jgi:hypothetical protein